MFAFLLGFFGIFSHRENAGTLGWYPSCLSPPRSPLKGNISSIYPLYKVYMGLIVKGPPSQGFSHHFPYDFRVFFRKLPRRQKLRPDVTVRLTIFLSPTLLILVRQAGLWDTENSLKTNMTGWKNMEKQPWMKMYLLWKMAIFLTWQWINNNLKIYLLYSPIKNGNFLLLCSFSGVVYFLDNRKNRSGGFIGWLRQATKPKPCFALGTGSKEASLQEPGTPGRWYSWWFRNPANHLGCIKPCKYWDKLPINWCRISSINTSFTYFLSFQFWDHWMPPILWGSNFMLKSMVNLRVKPQNIVYY